MSRIGKQPVPVPADVEVTLKDGTVAVKGKHGQLAFKPHPNVAVEFNDDSRQLVVTRQNDQRQNRALHGLTRALLSNMVRGVTTPFEKRLEIIGVGYNAVIAGKDLQLQVGFANAVKLPIPANVTCTVPDPTHIILTSADKQAVGQFAAEVRNVRPPEPYKGKGIRYQGEFVRRKAGKAFASK